VWSNTLLWTRWQPHSCKGNWALFCSDSSYILIFVCFIGLRLCATFQIISYKTCILSSSRAVNVDQHTGGGNEHFSDTAVSATYQVYILHCYRKLDRILNPLPVGFPSNYEPQMLSMKPITLINSISGQCGSLLVSHMGKGYHWHAIIMCWVKGLRTRPHPHKWTCMAIVCPIEMMYASHVSHRRYPPSAPGWLSVTHPLATAGVVVAASPQKWTLTGSLISCTNNNQ